MDTTLYATIFSGVSMMVSGVTAVVVAYLGLRKSQVDLMAQQISHIKENSDSNRAAIIGIAAQSKDNGDAIEHTRVQNVRLAERVEVTKVQNDELAEAVGHVHTCVEVKVDALKEVVEKVPECVKEVVPAMIKEVVPAVIKEIVPEAVKAAIK